MSAKWQRVKIEIPPVYGPTERRAIAQDIVDFIVERSKDGRDKNNRPFAGYSKEYQESLDFKIAGKSKSVDLTLSGDMLGALDLLAHRKGEVVVGYQKGTDENGRADGNIRGTYGNSRPVGPARDFLGITKKDLKTILAKYPVAKSGPRAELVTRAQDLSRRAVSDSDEGED